MKYIISIFFVAFSLNVIAQDNLSGQYRDYFGNHIQINGDNTFKYTWYFDMQSSWTKGMWKSKGDTIIFQMVPLYDTLNKGSKSKLTDTLILSIDEIAERITPDPNAATFLYGYGQNKIEHPDKLIFRKGRLYKILNGHLLTKKQKGFWTNKKWHPWYFKSLD